jgi:hypothetical protein
MQSPIQGKFLEDDETKSIGVTGILNQPITTADLFPASSYPSAVDSIFSSTITMPKSQTISAPVANTQPISIGPAQSATLKNIEVETSGRDNGSSLGWGHPVDFNTGAGGSYDVSDKNNNVSVTSDVSIWGTGWNGGVCNSPIPAVPFNNGGEFNLYLKNQQPGYYEVEVEYSGMTINTAKTGGPKATINVFNTWDAIKNEQEKQKTIMEIGVGMTGKVGVDSDANRATVMVQVNKPGETVKILNYYPRMAISSKETSPNPMSRATTNITVKSIREVKLPISGGSNP